MILASRAVHTTCLTDSCNFKSFLRAHLAAGGAFSSRTACTHRHTSCAHAGTYTHPSGPGQQPPCQAHRARSPVSTPQATETYHGACETSRQRGGSGGRQVTPEARRGKGRVAGRTGQAVRGGRTRSPRLHPAGRGGMWYGGTHDTPRPSKALLWGHACFQQARRETPLPRPSLRPWLRGAQSAGLRGAGAAAGPHGLWSSAVPSH